MSSDSGWCAAAMASRRLYIHIPWCRTVCPYCAFDVRLLRDFSSQQWSSLLAQSQQLVQVADQYDSIYIGGGTPSTLSPDQISQLMAVFASKFAPEAEVTIEANIEDVDATLVQAWRDSGINRVSLGVQSFDPKVLKSLGRARTRVKIDQALGLVSDHFESWSLDLIYGHRDQSLEVWNADLESALAWQPPHLSAYALTIEEGTAYAGHAMAVRDDALAEYYSALLQQLDASSLALYEVSNAAAPGHRARHNSAYWTMQDYAAIGPSAAGKVKHNGTNIRYRMHSGLEWGVAADVDATAHWTESIQDHEFLTPGQELDEQLMLGMRSDLGIDCGLLSPTQIGLLETWSREHCGSFYDDGRWRLLRDNWFVADGFVYVLSGQT